ncbi:MAG TPA: hypothetical protein VN723_14580 [Rhizomicrobium sp.]|nr:hypothetical protein [Rhizomicrobium sp.]
MTNQDKNEDLTGRLGSPGWRLKTGKTDETPVTGTLEHMVRATHDRKSQGQSPGLIEEIETRVELDLIQIEKLWRYLGLPV